MYDIAISLLIITSMVVGMLFGWTCRGNRDRKEGEHEQKG